MRTSNRDRRGALLTALCLALILVSAPAAAEEAVFRVLPDGTAYEAMIEVSGDTYALWTPGLLGERVPLQVEDLEVFGQNGAVEYREERRGVITFPEGNYTISYRVPVKNNQFVAAFDEPYNVTVLLPSGFEVDNPLIGMVSTGGVVSQRPNGTTEITWEGAMVVEVRFYTLEREILLTTFGTMWLVVAFILIFPFFFSRRRGGR